MKHNKINSNKAPLNINLFLNEDGISNELNETHRDDLLVNLSESIIIFDKDTSLCMDQSKTIENIFGYGYTESVGELRIDSIFPKDYERLINITQSDNIETVNTTARHKDGSFFSTEIRACLRVINELNLIVIGIPDISDKEQTSQVSKNKDKIIEEIQKQILNNNDALQEIIKLFNGEKEVVGKHINSNINKLILPLLGKLSSKVNSDCHEYIKQLKDSIEEITSPFINKLEFKFNKLTPREIQICNLIIKGLLTKEIAALLDVSIETIKCSRKIIRAKLGIKSKKINLRSYLETYNKP